jgi:hypothetical protein
MTQARKPLRLRPKTRATITALPSRAVSTMTCPIRSAASLDPA